MTSEGTLKRGKPVDRKRSEGASDLKKVTSTDPKMKFSDFKRFKRDKTGLSQQQVSQVFNTLIV